MEVGAYGETFDFGLENAKEFKVTNNSAKLFSLLSTVLYSNKELAVIRENADNALDIHVQTGKGHIPIEITIPTHSDPFYRIRDFGTGLSEENVYSLLTTYGESTKTATNSQIGGFGIGFKSTASVTNKWSVTSFHNGEKIGYLIYVNDEGIPNISKVQTEPSDETGLEISIPVDVKKIQVWMNATREAFKHYPVKPKFNTYMDIPTVKYKHTGKAFCINTPEGYYSGSKIDILSSNRSYAVSLESVKTNVDESLHCLFNMGLVIPTAIGQVDLSLSRETIQFTAKTLAYVTTALATVRAELQNAVIDTLSGASDSLSFRKELRKLPVTIFGASNASVKEFLMKVVTDNYPQYNIKCFDRDTTSIMSTFGIDTGLKLKYWNGTSIKTITEKTQSPINYAYDSDECELSLSFPIDHLDNITFVHADVYDYAARVKTLGEKLVVITSNFRILPNEVKCKVIKASSLEKVKSTFKGIKNVNEYYRQYKNSWTKCAAPKADATKACYVVLTNAKSGTLAPFYNLSESAMQSAMSYLLNGGYTIYGVKSAFEGITIPSIDTVLEAVVNSVTPLMLEAHTKALTVNTFSGTTYSKLFNYGITTDAPSLWNEAYALSKSTKANTAYSQALINVYFILKNIPAPDNGGEWVAKLNKAYPLIDFMNMRNSDYEYLSEATKAKADIKAYLEMKSKSDA